MWHVNNVIHTGTGDGGKTWVGRMRVDKDCEFVDLVGDIDEAVSLLGLIVSEGGPSELLEAVEVLMDVASYIGTGGSKRPVIDVEYWEKRISELWREAGPLNKFVMFFSDPLAAKIHLARAVVRRAERSYVRAMKVHPWLEKSILKLLNRLSDYLFALARVVNKRRGGKEVYYSKE